MRYPLTIENVRQAISYDPETGIVIRLLTGNIITNHNMKIDGVTCETSHAIWAFHYGEWPPEDRIVDHKDRNRHNRRITNLRLATIQENGFNQTRYSSSGYKGVYDCGRKSKPWQAQIRINGEKVNLGRFKTKEEAAEAYRQAALKYHGEFACLD